MFWNALELNNDFIKTDGIVVHHDQEWYVSRTSRNEKISYKRIPLCLTQSVGKQKKWFAMPWTKWYILQTQCQISNSTLQMSKSAILFALLGFKNNLSLARESSCNSLMGIINKRRTIWNHVIWIKPCWLILVGRLTTLFQLIIYLTIKPSWQSSIWQSELEWWKGERTFNDTFRNWG